MDYSKLKGVIHIGASEGQERDLYNKNSLNVLWIEPIPKVYKKLQENIRNYPNQTCLNFLVTNKDDQEYDFNISSNNGESSSILELSLHKTIWPTVRYVDTLKLKSKTLPTIIEENDVDLSNYDSIVLDTQGSELLILKSSLSILKNIQYVCLEVADFESYKGCCTLNEVDKFFNDNGFERVELIKWKWKTNYEFGNYYDAVYCRLK